MVWVRDYNCLVGHLASHPQSLNWYETRVGHMFRTYCFTCWFFDVYTHFILTIHKSSESYTCSTLTCTVYFTCNFRFLSSHSFILILLQVCTLFTVLERTSDTTVTRIHYLLLLDKLYHKLRILCSHSFLYERFVIENALQEEKISGQGEGTLHSISKYTLKI